MSKIYLCVGSNQYEGSENIRAFVFEGAAQALADACTAYKKSRPRAPEVEASDAAWRRFDRMEKNWQKHHPAGPTHYEKDYYTVESIELEESQ